MGVLATVATALLIATAGGSAATNAARTGVFTGYGFDACTAPATASLQAWSASPYRALGIYIGGVNRACKQANLTPQWVTSTLGLGWNLLPLYVGLQAPCLSGGFSHISTVAATAANQGRAAADDAVAKAVSLGLPTGSPVYFDMEGYSTSNASCTKAVQSFVTSWVSELHAQSYVAGVYGSAGSTIRDLAALTAGQPDDVWIANWNGVEAVFGDPHVSDTLWANHQRIHQYKGGHRETYGGVTIDVDSDYVDAAVVGAGTPQAPPPPPPTTTPVVGTVNSGDGKATVTWDENAFGSTSVVTLTPMAQAPSPNGYGVQLSVTDSVTQAVVAGFGDAVDLHLLVPTNGLAPSFSADGTTWKPIPLLKTAALPTGVDAGYTLDSDGTVEIHTLLPGFFGLLPDTTPPSQPASFTGRFVKNALVITWQPATDNSGSIANYQVLLDGTPVASVSGTTRRTTVHAFHPTGQTVYRIRAVDPSGILGKPTPPLVVVPTAKPTDLPKALPHWVWGLLAYQHGQGTRPANAPKRLPAWYWTWAAWRLTPFHLARG